ncbi:MAG: Hpt domain-containing protein [Zoogloea sp.]|nr:Hpt domain-containing protein [Zoogloea sp.]
MESFPDIAGIDRERAAKRLGQDRAMFLGLLELFIADNADAARRARSELARGERESAARRMHTLRSNAGFLCALDIMALASELEEAIERGDTQAALEAGLVELDRQISELVEAGAPWC